MEEDTTDCGHKVQGILFSFLYLALTCLWNSTTYVQFLPRQFLPDIQHHQRWIHYSVPSSGSLPVCPVLLLFCRSVVSFVSISLQPHGLQHARLPCPSLSPWICSNSCSLSWWYHPTISSSVTPFSSYPQYFPASGYFSMSQLFRSGDQSIGASTSALSRLFRLRGFLFFHTNCEIICSSSVKNTVGSLIGIALNL